MMERRYIEFTTPESAEVVDDTVGAPGDDDVIISVHHAGINRADLLQRMGLYPPPEDASPVPGLEVSGKLIDGGDLVGMGA